jgi:5'-nucleotidase
LRVLITNDDGIMAPGIAALAASASQAGHEVLVAAPLTDYSGSSAAVGPVYERASVNYKAFDLVGLDGIPSYGLDASPALSVLLCCLGAFGPPPELVLSGINHGANIGRSVLHSGTVGAALTAAHFHISAIAVSIKYGPDPVPWETPAALAQQLAGRIAGAPAGTVLNLNVPNVPLEQLKGISWGSLGRSGLIKAAAAGMETDRSGTLPRLSVQASARTESNAQTRLPDAPEQSTGSITLELTSYATGSAPTGLTTETPSLEVDTDADLIARGYASVTPLAATRESTDPATSTFVRQAIEEMLDLRADLRTTAATDSV